MADGVWRRLVTEYPEYPELHSLLALAAITWPRYGLSADTLSMLPDSTLEMLQLMVLPE